MSHHCHHHSHHHHLSRSLFTRLRARIGPDRGQATAEYALVLLAAAALAGLALAWATSTDAIDRLFDAVVESVIDDVSE